MAYAELQAATNFSFLRGASHPWELVVTAKALGLSAIGVADRNTLAGVVRAWAKGREIGQRVVAGARLDFADGTPSVLCYPADRAAWGRLTRLLTVGQRRALKGECHLERSDLFDHGEGQLLIVLPPPRLDEAFEADLADSPAPSPGAPGWPARAATPPRTSSGCTGWTPWAARRRPARGRRRRALSRARAADAAGRGHLHPRRGAPSRRQA